MKNLYPEKDFQSTVTDLFKLKGWRVYHNPDSRRSEAGWPDLMLLKPPHFLMVELKTDTGKVKPIQDMVMRELNSSNVTVNVWRPADWPEIERVANL